MITKPLGIAERWKLIDAIGEEIMELAGINARLDVLKARLLANENVPAGGQIVVSGPEYVLTLSVSTKGKHVFEARKKKFNEH